MKEKKESPDLYRITSKLIQHIRTTIQIAKS